jgi:hypothetical protein
MQEARWLKDPNVIVIPGDDGLRLFSRSTSSWRSLDREMTEAWDAWAPARLEERLDDLVAAGMVRRASASPYSESFLDDVRFSRDPLWARVMPRLPT